MKDINYFSMAMLIVPVILAFFLLAYVFAA
jgi:hypothetical protein